MRPLAGSGHAGKRDVRHGVSARPGEAASYPPGPHPPPHHHGDLAA